jgi:hypothetical protein
MLATFAVVVAALAPGALLFAAPGTPGDTPGVATRVYGEKIDSGLGRLPHYRHWGVSQRTAVPGEKLDSGLGDLAPWHEWTDDSGTRRAPGGRPARFVMVARTGVVKAI